MGPITQSYRGDPADLFAVELRDYVDGPPAFFTDAACRGAGPGIFFLERGKSADAAKAICANCTVVEPCLAYAHDTKQADGVYGGLSPVERRRARLR